MRLFFARPAATTATRSAALFALLTGCAVHEIYPSREAVYWDQPATGWYWIGEGIKPADIITVARDCGAKVDGSVANHGVVPHGYSMTVFRFIEDTSAQARECTIARLSAVPQLTTYLR
jgi:hypothetical protein